MTNDTTPEGHPIDGLTEQLASIEALGDGVAEAAAPFPGTTDTVSTAEVAPEVPPEPKPPSFDDLGLHPDVKLALDDMGYFVPTPVQTAVFQPVTDGKDLLVQSRTGTGKTTAFGLPIVSKIVPSHRAPQALILTPTRELALQVAREITQIGKHRGVIVECVYGGAPIGKQIRTLREGVHVVVGTPGRVLDHIGRRTLDCRTVSMFVLDECDEMLSMGFLEDIERVVSHLPEKKQTMLFSATMPEEVQRYSRRHMRAPETISLSRDGLYVQEIHHAYYICSGIARSRDLLKVLFAEDPESALIFCNTRDETSMVAKFLQRQGLDAEPLSSDLSQADRERVMGRMKQHNLRFLCATDVAARGIDISNLSHVINYMVPEQPEVYVHRTGRTGRIGKTGTALSLVGPRELGNFRYVKLQYGIKFEERVLPKDDIFVGKLKHPLPPVGTPQPPDPIQILLRGVQGQPTDLERSIFEKLLAKADGKRVLAQLVAEKLNGLTTRTRPKRPPREREEHAEHHHEGEERGERPDRGERRFDREGGERRDRGDRDERRPRRFEDGDRPRWRDREDRGERREGREGQGREERGERPQGREERGDRGDRPWRDRDDSRRDRHGRDRDRGERHEHRDRQERRDEAPPPVQAAAEPTPEPGTEAAPPVEVREEPRREHRERDRDRDRGDRRDRDRDRGERHEHRDREHRDRDRDRDREPRDRDRDRDREPRDRDRDRRETRETLPPPIATPPSSSGQAEHPLASLAEAAETPLPRSERPTLRYERRDTLVDFGEQRSDAPAEASAEQAHATKVDDVARAALERADRGKGKKKSEPTAETREFWETWADEKSTRPEPAPAAAAPAAEAESDTEEERPAREERRSRGRDRGRDRDKDKGRKHDKDKDKDDKHERRKTGAAATSKKAAEPASEGGQTRLFVSLGKKHGVSAEDLRTLLAAPIGGDKARIGSVSLRDSHAHVRVPDDVVDDIIKGVNGTQHNEHDVTVERARS
jgi:superfamily II DNA/RNA helicase